jgi:hypothetical protein
MTEPLSPPLEEVQATHQFLLASVQSAGRRWTRVSCPDRMVILGSFVMFLGLAVWGPGYFKDDERTKLAGRIIGNAGAVSYGSGTLVNFIAMAKVWVSNCMEPPRRVQEGDAPYTEL